MILIINVCKEKLHYYEFVKPIEDILIKSKIKFITINYKELTRKDLDIASKVIICGTSLKDNEFIKNLKKFNWIKDFKKPILGICAGMQVIGLLYDGRLKKEAEIGFYNENINILGFKKQKVYHLHNYYVDFTNTKDLKVLKNNKIIQAIKHRDKEIYGVLFHPEVRNKEIIINFLKK